MTEALAGLLARRKGHFLLESGHHGDLWLDLELLCLRPKSLRPFVTALSQQLERYQVQAVCGPLVEGSFVALMAASELEVVFSYSERFEASGPRDLYPVQYRVPDALRAHLRGKRVAILNDVINAGSAVRGTLADLRRCGATPVAVGTLVVLGTRAADWAADEGLPLETLLSLPNVLWEPSECPLCAAGVPLVDVAGFQTDSGGVSVSDVPSVPEP